MPTIKTVVREVSSSLLDQKPGKEYSRWKVQELLSYLRDALASLSSYRPDAFSSTEAVTLQPGRMQRLPEGAVSLSSIDSNVDGSESPVTIANHTLARAFNPRACGESSNSKDCAGNPQYRVRSYTYDPKAPTVFYISPPVPSSGAYSVQATVIRNPPDIDSTNWNDDIGVDLKYVPILKDYMLGRAYGKETESVTSMRLASTHMAAFYQALGVNYKQESRFHSGYYLGQRGEGDPQAGVR